jgi:hypothetical protein
MKKIVDSQFSEKTFFSLILIFFLVFIIFSQMPQKSPYFRHYYFLSQSLIRGKLDVTDQLKTTFDTSSKLKRVFDYAVFNEKYFLHLGVFPAIVGIPFLIFGAESYMVLMALSFLGLTVATLAKIINHFIGKQALLTALLLVISSPLLTTITWRGPWYLSGLMIAAWGLLFLWLYLIKKRNWATLLIVPLTLTRPTTFFYSLIPLASIISKKEERKKKMLLLAASLTITLAVFFGYNYLRFGNIFETGYRYAVIPQEEFKEFREKEIFSLNYFLSNAIYMFINPPRVYLNKALRFIFPYFELSRFGVGLIFSIPWFFSYLFFNRKKNQDWLFLITILAITLSILAFGGEGSFQMTSRYACDFLPLLFFINLRWLGEKKKYLPFFQKLLFIALILNIYFFLLVQLGHIRRV